jgi:hypothetical protein
MNQREWFELGTRWIGLWMVLVEGMGNCWYSIFFHRFAIDQRLVHEYPKEYVLIVGVFYCVIGAMLLFRADLVTNLVYGPSALSDPASPRENMENQTDEAG